MLYLDYWYMYRISYIPSQYFVIVFPPIFSSSFLFFLHILYASFPFFIAFFFIYSCKCIYHCLSCIHHHTIPHFSAFFFSPIIPSVTSIMQLFYLMTCPILYCFPYNSILYSIAKVGSSNFFNLFFLYLSSVFSLFSVNISLLIKSDQSDSLVLTLIEHQ